MSYRTSNIICIIYDDNNTAYDIGDFITEISYTCQLARPYQEVNFKLAYAIYSTTLPNIYIKTGTKIELYRADTRECIFKGFVNVSKIDSSSETLKVTAYDYIFNINKSKVVYNFKDMSAYDCIKTILDDLQIPYSEKGILGGSDTSNSKVSINHKIANRTAYDAIMAICTTVRRNTGDCFYIYMDVAGNVNVDTCDRYWSNQTIKTSTNTSHNRAVANGNVLSYTYKEDSTELITRVKLYNQEGGRVDFNTGEEEDLDTDSTGSSSSGSNGKVIGVDMGHNSHVPGASALLDEIAQNRAVGEKLIKLLKSAGYGVVNTTDNDGTTESQELTNRVGKMNAQKLDLSISIHFDAGGGSGTSVYYNAKAGNSLAYGFLTKISQSCGFNSRTVSLHDGSDGGQSFKVLRDNNNPAILIEVCFVDSTNDAKIFNADKVAQGILEAIKAEV